MSRDFEVEFTLAEPLWVPLCQLCEYLAELHVNDEAIHVALSLLVYVTSKSIEVSFELSALAGVHCLSLLHRTFFVVQRFLQEIYKYVL